MSLLDKLGLSDNKKKTPVFSSYTQKQAYLRVQAKKQKQAVPSKPVSQKVKRECPVCEQAMNVPVGTIMHCHKECKSRYKRAVVRLKNK